MAHGAFGNFRVPSPRFRLPCSAFWALSDVAWGRPEAVYSVLRITYKVYVQDLGLIFKHDLCRSPGSQGSRGNPIQSSWGGKHGSGGSCQ